MKRRGQLAIIRRAINQGWDTTPEMQRQSIEFVFSVLDDDEATNREKLSALSTLSVMIRNEQSTDAQIRKRAADALRRYCPKLLKEDDNHVQG